MFVKNCRICLSNQNDNIPLFSTEQNDPTSLNSVGQMYRDCFRLELTHNQDYPKYICNYCSIQLAAFHTFLVIAKQSYDKFTTSVRTAVKSEVVCDIVPKLEVVEAPETPPTPDTFEPMLDSSNIKTEITEDQQPDGADAWVINYVDDAELAARNEQNIVEVKKEPEVQEEIPEAKITWPQNPARDDEESDDQDDFIKSDPEYQIYGRRRSNQIKYLCKPCGKKFKPHTYQAHMNVHKGLPKFICELCKNAYNSRSGYRDHMLKHWNGYSHTCSSRYETLLTPKSCKICSFLIQRKHQWPYSGFPKKTENVE